MVPGPTYPELRDAVARARELASKTDTQVELPGGSWYTFPETSSERIGPPPAPGRPKFERRTRRFEGVEVFRRARCTLDGIPARVENVSEGGFGVSLRDAPVIAVGRTMRLEITDRRSTFNAEVTVAWVRDGRAGLTISDSSNNIVARSFLRQLVRRAARGLRP